MNERTTREVGSGDGRASTKSAGQLMKEVSEDLSTLIRKEIELAKLELGGAVTEKVKGAVMFAIVGLFGFFALIFMLLAIRDGIDEGLPTWAADLVTVGILAVMAVIVVLVARKKIATPIKADLTKQTIKEDVETFKTLGRSNGPPGS
ncbi:MAG: phage holin family protein [Actinomycetota bacterium]